MQKIHFCHLLPMIKLSKVTLITKYSIRRIQHMQKIHKSLIEDGKKKWVLIFKRLKRRGIMQPPE